MLQLTACESSKGRSIPGRFEGRLAQLEERLVCNQAAVGSNPTASTLPVITFSRGRFATPFARKARFKALATASTIPHYPCRLRVSPSKKHDAATNKTVGCRLTGCVFSFPLDSGVLTESSAVEIYCDTLGSHSPSH